MPVDVNGPSSEVAVSDRDAGAGTRVARGARRAIVGAVVDDHHLDVRAVECERRVDRVANPAAVVEARDDDADARAPHAVLSARRGGRY